MQSLRASEKKALNCRRMHIPLFLQIKREARTSSLESRGESRPGIYLSSNPYQLPTDRQRGWSNSWDFIWGVVKWVLCVCVCVCSCKHTAKPLGNIQHYGVHTSTCFIHDPGSPRGGRNTVGPQQRRGLDRKLSGITSKYLFLPFCADLTVLIWQQQNV